MKRTKTAFCFLLAFIVLLFAAVTPHALRASVFSSFSDREETLITAQSEENLSENIESMSVEAADENISAAVDAEEERKTEKSDLGAEKKYISAAVTPDGAQTEKSSFYNYRPGSDKEITIPLSLFSENEGLLTVEKSINAYTFSLDKRGMFKYSMSYKAANDFSGWDLSLYQEYLLNGIDGEKGYRLINVLSVMSADKNASSPEIGLIAGDYRIVITPKAVFPKTAYKLKAEFTPGGFYETECNDNVYRYTEIYSGAPLKGSASRLPQKTDEDYYMLRTFTDGYVEIKFEHKKSSGISVCWQLALFDESGRELFSANSALFEQELNSGKIGLRAGNYYISVKNRVYTDITYTLLFNRSAENAFEKEFNDSYAESQPIEVNSLVSGSLTSRLNEIDRDYFAFEVTENGYARIEFEHAVIPEKPDDEEKIGWRVILSDEAGDYLYSGCSAWCEEVLATPLIGLKKGRYYISVDADYLYAAPETYTLYLNFNQTDSWEKEFNNSFESANELSEGVPIWGALVEIDADYDFDHFTFRLVEKSDVSLIFSHEKLNSDRDIFVFTLYDENFEKVGFTDENGEFKYSCVSFAGDESVKAFYTLLPAGKYYVKVSTGKFFDNIRYSLVYKCN